MIRLYCQYSFGGFKTLYIEGIENESLNPDSEVTLDNSHGFPEDANKFFMFGRCKMAYLKLTTGELVLVVREIPSNDVDSAGRAISCSIQFIGQEEDRETLDNLAIVIANDIAGFEKFVADLFYVRQGLHIEGNRIRTFINKWSNKITFEGEMHPTLLSINKKKKGVFMFVPLSEKFGRDKDVTNRVCEELKLKKEYLRGSIIEMKELIRIQKNLSINSLYNDINAENVQEEHKDNIKVNYESRKENSDESVSEKSLNNADMDSSANKHIVELENEIKNLNTQIKEMLLQRHDETASDSSKTQSTSNKKNDENKKTIKRLGLYKKLTYIFGISTVILLILLIIALCTR